MFIKLFTQILDSSIADNRQLRHLFTDLLLCADPKGMIMMTPSAIARRIGATVEEVQWGLEELQKPDPMSKTPDLDGSRIEALEGLGYGWRIVNYEAYRAMRDADQMREATKARVKRYREKKMGNVTRVTDDVTHVTPGNASQKESQSQTQSQSQTSPLSADAEEEMERELFEHETPAEKKKRLKKEWKPTPEQVIINEWFDRRDSTAWNEKEMKAFRAIPHQTILDGIDDMDLYYRSDCTILRKDVQTLLNNWVSEMDRGAKYKAQTANHEKYKSPL
jgi:hypothetical protein